MNKFYLIVDFLLDFRIEQHQYYHCIIMQISSYKTKSLFFSLILMVFFSCQEDPERHLELGNWYLQKGLIDDAITEFREVSRLLPPDHSKLNRNQFKILGTAHFQKNRLSQNILQKSFFQVKNLNKRYPFLSGLRWWLE